MFFKSKKYILLFLTPILLSCNCEVPLPPNGGGGILSPKVIWKYPALGGSNWVQPVIYNDNIYAAFDSSLLCFNIKDGSLVWKKSLENKTWLASSKLLFNNNQLFINHSSWVKSFDLEGTLLWNTSIDNLLAIDISIMTQNNNNIFLGRRGDVLSVSKNSGNIDLTIKLDSLIPENITQFSYNPVVSDDNLLYVPTGYWDPENPPVRGNMFCYDAITGEYKWGFKIPNKKILLPGAQDSTIIDSGSYGCAVDGDKVVFAASATVFALNRFTGELIWEKMFPDDAFGWGLTIYQNTIYIGSQGNAYMYALDLTNGNLKWRSRISGSMFNIITVENGKVFYCVTLGGDIFIQDAATGTILWNDFPPEYDTDRNAIYHSNLAVGEGYMINVGTKYVYCLKIEE
jgi:outer membrane protein assembly factor BamB